MNLMKSLWRSAPLIRKTILTNNVRLLSTPATPVNTIDSHSIPVESKLLKADDSPMVSTESKEELDKLFKRVELEMRGVDPAVLLSYSWFCIAAASHLGIEVTKSWALRKAEKERLTLLRAVHIYKKHKVQYEVRTYFRFICLQRLTGSTCDTYLEYIERNLPEGCALKVTKVECQPMPDYIKPPNEQ